MSKYAIRAPFTGRQVPLAIRWIAISVVASTTICAIVAVRAGSLERQARVLPGDDAEITVFAKDEDTPYSRMARLLVRELNERTEESTNAEIDQIKKRGLVSKAIEPVRFTIKKTTGSLHTLSQMREQHPSIGIVQADVLFHFVKGGHPQMPYAHEDKTIVALSNLFPEIIHVSSTARLPSAPDTAHLPFRHGKVCTEQLGSGSWITAQNIRRLLPTEWETLLPADQCSIDNGRSPDPTIYIKMRSEPIINSRSSRWLYFDEHQAGVLSAQFPDVYRAQPCAVPGVKLPDEYDACRIGDSYDGGAPNCPLFGRPYRCRAKVPGAWAVATDAVLVATEDVPIVEVRRVLAYLESLGTACPEIPSEIRDTLFCDARERRFTKFPIAPHLESKKKHLELKQRWAGAVVRILDNGVFTIGVGLAAGGFVLWVVVPVLVARFGGRAVMFAGGLAVATFVALSVALFLSEFRANAFFDLDLMERAPLWFLHYWVVGEPTEKLVSPVSLALVMAANLAIYLLVGLAGALFVARINGVVRSMRDHVIVLGLGELQEIVVNELRQQELEFVLVAIRKGQPEVTESERRSVIGSDLRSVLGRAQFNRSRSVIVLADEVAARERAMGVDEYTLIVSKEIRSIGTEQGWKGKIVAEVVHAELRDALRQSEEIDEVVCVRRFGAELLAHAVTKPGIVDVFDELTITSAGMEIYVDPLSHDDLRKCATVTELQTWYDTQSSSGGLPRRLVIGVLRARAGRSLRNGFAAGPRSTGGQGLRGSSGVHLNPPAAFRLASGDSAIVIAMERKGE